MDDSNQIIVLLTNLAYQLPSLLAMLAGIVIAIVRWKRYPRVSLMVVISLVLMIVHAVVFAIIYLLLNRMVGYGNFQRLRTLQIVAAFAYNFLLAIITAILLAAIFIKRNDSSGTPDRSYAAAARAA